MACQILLAKHWQAWIWRSVIALSSAQYSTPSVRIARKYLPVPFFFVNFVSSYYPIVGNELLALIGGSACHIRKTFAWRFLLTFQNLGNSKKMFRGRQRWASTHRVYTHGTGVPLRMEGVRSVLSYIYLLGVGICCFFSLVRKVFLGPQ